MKTGDFIILESGSTCQAVIPHLTEKRDLKVITVSNRIAMLLAEVAEKHHLDMEIICSGGVLNVYKDFMTGSHARDFFENIKVDLALISPTAVDLEAGITADSYNEAEITRIELTQTARRKIGLVVSSKFGKTSFVKIAPVEIFDEIITGANISSSIVDVYSERGIKTTIV